MNLDYHIADTTPLISGSNIEFILSTIGSVVGLGNLWRFPIKVKQYGGGETTISLSP